MFPVYFIEGMELLKSMVCAKICRTSKNAWSFMCPLSRKLGVDCSKKLYQYKFSFQISPGIHLLSMHLPIYLLKEASIAILLSFEGVAYWTPNGYKILCVS